MGPIKKEGQAVPAFNRLKEIDKVHIIPRDKEDEILEKCLKKHKENMQSF